jgi:hypothetical protein
MEIIHMRFGHPKALGSFNTIVGPILNLIMLDQQSYFFKLTMQNHGLVP